MLDNRSIKQSVKHSLTHLLIQQINLSRFSELDRGQREHQKRLSSIQDNPEVPFDETPLGRLSARLQKLISVRHVLRQKPASAWRRNRSDENSGIGGGIGGGGGGSNPSAMRPPFRPAGENILRSAIGQLTTGAKPRRKSDQNEKDDSVFSSPTGARTPSGRMTPNL